MAKKKEDNVLVAIDKDKGSQHALKWAVDHLLTRYQTVTLLHVKLKPLIPTVPSSGSHLDDDVAKKGMKQLDTGKELFLPFRCFCTRKEIHCDEVLLEDVDISKAILNYVSENAVEILVLGAPAKGGLVRRFRATDMPTNIQKAAPEFCTIYIIAKEKVSSVRAASAPPPPRPALQNQLQNKATPYELSEPPMRTPSYAPRERSMHGPTSPSLQDNMEIKSPFTRARGPNSKPYEPSALDSDISFVSSGRPSTDHMFPSFTDSVDSGMTPRYSVSSEYDLQSFGSSYTGNKSMDMSTFSSTSQENARMSWSSQSQNMDDVETEMRRLKLELKQTMDMYSSACKEALAAKQKANELHRWKLEEQQKLEKARLAEEAALALVEKEKAKSKAAIEAAEAAQRIVELEAQKRIKAEKKALREAEERKKAMQSLGQGDLRYRKYTIEEIEAATQDFADSLKIGGGGYGPVYKCYLDHTSVAVKVLRPDAAQGRAQFQQEVEVLSCIRHPNMVLLLGACPEYGCLVYEYMANGSLEDCLFRRGNSPTLSWQMRFRISAEIATALLFLHQTKPEPLVHRDLKPGNILLDHNYVSKISDVGLARLVPPSVANNVTQYRMTTTAGTFCYIDPEYQQTGMLGIKSDIYSLGIMLLQIITAKPPMGLTYNVERAIEKGTFAEMLDPAVTDWPIEEAIKFAKLALKCAELRRKDRPDLGGVILPELNKLRALAEDNMPNLMVGCIAGSPHNQVSTVQDVMSDQQSGYESSRSHSSTSSFPGRKQIVEASNLSNQTK